MDISKRVFAFIESNTTGSGFLFLEKALELGFQVLFLTQDKSKYLFLNDLSVTVIEINTRDHNLIVKSLRQFSNLVGVFSTSEYYVHIASVVAGVLRLPGNNPQAIADCRDKRVFYDKLEGTPACIPKTLFINNLEDVVALKRSLQFPLIVKPVAGTGSIGVKKCSTFSELCEHVSEWLANEVQGCGLLIQNYIVGPEYSAEIIAVGHDYYLLGITAKHTTDSEYFIETGHDFPARLSEELELSIWLALKRALLSLGFSFGPAHIEFKITDKEPVLIEVNPRLAGGMIPQLICNACDIDLYKIILSLYATGVITMPRLNYKGSSIRFFVAKKSGMITTLSSEDSLRGSKGVVDVYLSKQIGDSVAIHNDYRDRIGYLITKGEDSKSSQYYADQAMRKFFLEIKKKETLDSGRLSAGPHAVIKEIVCRYKSRNSDGLMRELERIACIDLCHVLMLFKNGIVDYRQTALIVEVIQDFQKNIEGYAENLDFSTGSYYAYEHHLRSKLGTEISGNNHIARSRNDINATLFHLICRENFLKLYKSLLCLSKALISQASISAAVPLPIYSQHQPAMPGNYAFYLLAINEPLSRILDDLVKIESYLNTSPLGTGAGAGTDIVIDPDYVATLLGFKHTFSNALDAIANRDFAIRYKSILANLCMTLSRIAQDYQLWTTQEFRFFELPDHLCGSSSMMPQKKNPYILEMIKEKAADVISDLFSTLTKMHKVPIGNSVEVSTAAYDTIAFGSQVTLDILSLITLVVSEAKPLPKNMLDASRRGIIIATYATNQLMEQEGFSFREAHTKVGSIIREVKGNSDDAIRILSKYIQSASSMDNATYIAMQSLEYGSGPGLASVAKQIKKASECLMSFCQWIEQEELEWDRAKIRLDQEVNQLFASPLLIG